MDACKYWRCRHCNTSKERDKDADNDKDKYKDKNQDNASGRDHDKDKDEDNDKHGHNDKQQYKAKDKDTDKDKAKDKHRDKHDAEGGWMARCMEVLHRIECGLASSGLCFLLLRFVSFFDVDLEALIGHFCAGCTFGTSTVPRKG